MMSTGGSQNSLRKALGAIKDSTTVGLAKVNSDYKELDIAIVRATSHVERPAKEKHIRAIFAAISATRPRADVAYCIHALSRRLAKTHNWAVALKTLIVIHRALREVDPTFCEELINYGRSRSHMLNLAHFKDDSSPNAWDYSSWVRTYALFLEERLECFRVLKYDVDTDPPRMRDLDTANMLEQMPALQQLLFRVLGCQILYDVHMMEQYKGATFGELSPHLFVVADACYRALINEHGSQSILVSGESGAGKTETTKMLMNLAFMGGRSGTEGRTVEQQVLESNPVLEAFGNAKTVKNNNSSRFGKFVEIQFDKRGKISGAAVRTYLLESSRVCQVSDPERNYHCFYMLCSAPPEV